MVEQATALDVRGRPGSPKAEASRDDATREKDFSLTSVLTVAAVGIFFSILTVALAGLTIGE
jgi:hypothetical protein